MRRKNSKNRGHSYWPLLAASVMCATGKWDVSLAADNAAAQPLQTQQSPEKNDSAQNGVNTRSLAALQRSARSLQEAAQSLEEAVESLKNQKATATQQGTLTALPWLDAGDKATDKAAPPQMEKPAAPAAAVAAGTLPPGALPWQADKAAPPVNTMPISKAPVTALPWRTEAAPNVAAGVVAPAQSVSTIPQVNTVPKNAVQNVMPGAVQAVDAVAVAKPVSASAAPHHSPLAIVQPFTAPIPEKSVAVAVTDAKVPEAAASGAGALPPISSAFDSVAGPAAVVSSAALPWRTGDAAKTAAPATSASSPAALQYSAISAAQAPVPPEQAPMVDSPPATQNAKAGEKAIGIVLAADPFASKATVKYSVISSFLDQTKGMVSLNVGKYARSASVMEPIRMDEAVAFALKNNLEIQASQSMTKSAQLEKMTAYSRFLPSVDVKLSRGKEQSMPSSYNDVFGNRVLDDKHGRSDRLLAIRQPLIDLEVVADILNTTDKESMTKNQAAADRDGIAYDTIKAYLRLVQAKIAFDLASQYRLRLGELSEYMNTRVEVGGATPGDLERIKVHASMADAAKVEAQGEYETNLAEFRRLTQITPAQLEAVSVAAPAVPASLEEALSVAIKQNPDYIVSRDRVNIADSTRNSVFSKVVPKVALEYSDTFAYNAGGSAKGNAVDGVYPNQQDKRLMLVARWTINGGMEIGSGLTAIEKTKEARLRSLDVKSRLEEAMVASYNSIYAAEQRLDIMRSAINASEKVVNEFTDQYKNGSRSIFELLDAHGQLYNNRKGMMQMEVTRIMTAYQVHHQMGDLVPLLVNQYPKKAPVTASVKKD